MNKFFSPKFSNKRWIFRNFIIMKDKWKCKNPIICNSFKDQLKEQYKSRPNIRVLQHLLGNKTTSTISNTEQLPLLHNRWRWSVQTTAIRIHSIIRQLKSYITKPTQQNKRNFTSEIKYITLTYQKSTQFNETRNYSVPM